MHWCVHLAAGGLLAEFLELSPAGYLVARSVRYLISLPLSLCCFLPAVAAGEILLCGAFPGARKSGGAGGRVLAAPHQREQVRMALGAADAAGQMFF